MSENNGKVKVVMVYANTGTYEDESGEEHKDWTRFVAGLEKAKNLVRSLKALGFDARYTYQWKGVKLSTKRQVRRAFAIWREAGYSTEEAAAA